MYEKLVPGGNRQAVSLVLAWSTELGKNALQLCFLLGPYPCQEDSDLLQLLMAACGEQQVDVDSRLDSCRR